MHNILLIYKFILQEVATLLISTSFGSAMQELDQVVFSTKSRSSYLALNWIEANQLLIWGMIVGAWVVVAYVSQSASSKL